MTEAARRSDPGRAPPSRSPLRRAEKGRLRRRYAAEARFRLYGMLAVGAALAMLGLLLVKIAAAGYSGFTQTFVALDVAYDPAVLDPAGGRDPSALGGADYDGLIKQALGDLFPEATSRGDRRALNGLVSSGAAYALRQRILDDPARIGDSERVWVPAASAVDMLVKGFVPRDGGEAERGLSDRQVAWLDALSAAGRLERRFNAAFFVNGDSREPELAGVGGALAGTFLTMLVTLALSFPLGLATAVYLEEFAAKNRMAALIEVNVNNLAAVPSIVFGLLGLAILLGYFGLPRSAPLVGGMVLALMTLPTIIIAGRAALQAVPPSIREGALAIGASKLQVVAHHVLPLALPGILTGAIIGMARALGETAPLLMIGMVAFIVDVPHGPTDPATVLPVQVFLWADNPERGFVEKTSAAILVLLGFLAVMNALAVLLRRRFERRW